MIGKNDTEPDYIAIRDAAPGDVEYIPMNMKWSEVEYNFAIAQMANLPVPDETMNTEDIAVLQEQIQMVRKKFEEENEVHPEEIPDGFVVGEKVLTKQELANAISEQQMAQQQAGEEPMTEEEFLEIFQVEGPQPVIRYNVNVMSDDADLDVIYSIDTDIRTDPRFQLERAFIARKEGAMPLEDFLDALGFSNTKDMVERASRENENMAIAEAVGSNPELKELVLGAIKQINQQQQSKNGDSSGSPGAPAPGSDGKRASGGEGDSAKGGEENV